MNNIYIHKRQFIIFCLVLFFFFASFSYFSFSNSNQQYNYYKKIYIDSLYDSIDRKIYTKNRKWFLENCFSNIDENQLSMESLDEYIKMFKVSDKEYCK